MGCRAAGPTLEGLKNISLREARSTKAYNLSSFPPQVAVFEYGLDLQSEMKGKSQKDTILLEGRLGEFTAFVLVVVVLVVVVLPLLLVHPTSVLPSSAPPHQPCKKGGLGVVVQCVYRGFGGIVWLVSVHDI